MLTSEGWHLQRVPSSEGTPSFTDTVAIMLSLRLYMDCLQIVVVPAGAADAGELDFEAALCGCLLLKVEPESYVTYPDVFRPDDHILGVPFNWTGLSQQLDTALQVMSSSCILFWAARVIAIRSESLNPWSAIVSARDPLLVDYIRRRLESKLYLDVGKLW